MKNQNTRNALVLLVLLCSSLLSTGQTSLTFEEALQLTLQNNYLIKQADHHLLQMGEEVKTAKGLRFPRISLSAGYTLMEDKIELDLTPVRDAISPLYKTMGTYGVFSGVPNPDPATKGVLPVLPDNMSTQLVRQKLMDGYTSLSSADWNRTIQEKQFATLNAGFMWPVFTGGKINAANQAAKINYETIEIENRQKSYELTNELIERYFGLVLAQQASKVRQEVKSTMEKHSTDAKKLQLEGMIANVEALNAKLNLAEAERELQKANRQISILNDALANTLADQKNSEIQPVTNLFYVDSIESVDYFISRAIEKSPLLGQVSKKKELAQQGYKAEKSGHLPSIALTGIYDIANKDLSPYLPGYMVGVGLKWNLFEGNSQNSRVKALNYKKEQAEDFYKKASADIQTAISKNYQEMNMFLEQLHMLDASMELADEYYRVRSKAFSEGMATSTQVADASLARAKARIDRLQAMYGYDVALSKLLYLAGITEEYVGYMRRGKC